MFATLIVPEASSEAFVSPQELKPILAPAKPVAGDTLQKGDTSLKKGSRLQGFPSWEYFLNELEFE